MSDTLIISKDWEGKRCYLADRFNKPIFLGSIHKDFRGERVEVTGGSAPHSENSSGRVQVRGVCGTAVCSFFPSVIEARWVRFDPDPV